MMNKRLAFYGILLTEKTSVLDSRLKDRDSRLKGRVGFAHPKLRSPLSTLHTKKGAPKGAFKMACPKGFEPPVA